MSINAGYEPGMEFGYNPSTGRLTVMFRGHSTMLESIFLDEETAIRAGERFCASQGWTRGSVQAQRPSGAQAHRARSRTGGR